jgi:hypothetical protein
MAQKFFSKKSFHFFLILFYSFLLWENSQVSNFEAELNPFCACARVCVCIWVLTNLYVIIFATKKKRRDIQKFERAMMVYLFIFFFVIF